VEIVHQVLVFSLDLRVKRLDQVTDGNQPDQLTTIDHRQLTDVVFGHFSNGFCQGSFRAAGDGVGGLDFLDELVMEPFEVVMVPENHVAFGEDPKQFSCGPGDRQRADIVLDKQSQCLLDRRLRSDENLASPLRLENIADEHRGPPHSNRLDSGVTSRHGLSSNNHCPGQTGNSK
jgi:hypothetical protein